MLSPSLAEKKIERKYNFPRHFKIAQDVYFSISDFHRTGVCLKTEILTFYDNLTRYLLADLCQFHISNVFKFFIFAHPKQIENKTFLNCSNSTFLFLNTGARWKNYMQMFSAFKQSIVLVYSSSKSWSCVHSATLRQYRDGGQIKNLVGASCF